MSLKEFLDKNHSTINTTGHVLSFLQNQKIQKNQRHLAQIEVLNNSLLNEQNELREKELEKLEKLMDRNEKDRIEKERREKIKTEVLVLGPATKSLLKKIEDEKNDYDELTLNFLLRHAELNIQKMREHKSLINDINFFDYLHELDGKIDEISYSNKDVVKDFSYELADLLVDFKSIVLGAELLSKSKKDVLSEQSEDTKKYLKELRVKILDEVNDNRSLSELDVYLKKFNFLANKINGKESAHDLKEYPLPIRFDEGHYLQELIVEIENDIETFLNEVDRKVDDLLSVFKGGGESILDKLEGIIEKNANELNYDDIEFLVQKSNNEIVYIAKGKIDNLLSDLRSGLLHDKSIIQSISERDKVKTISSFKAVPNKIYNHIMKDHVFTTNICEEILLSSVKERSDYLIKAYQENNNRMYFFTFLSLFVGITLFQTTVYNVLILLPFLVAGYFIFKSSEDQVNEMKNLKNVIVSEIDEVDSKITTIEINMR